MYGDSPQAFKKRNWPLLLSCAAFTVGAWLVFSQIEALSSWLTSYWDWLILAGSVAVLLGLYHQFVSRMALRDTAAFLQHDAAPRFISTASGELLFRNKAAFQADMVGGTIEDVLTRYIAQAEDTVADILSTARHCGQAEETILTLTQRVQCKVTKTRGRRLVWAITLIDNETTTVGEWNAYPSITTAQNGKILFLNEKARALIGPDVQQISDVLGQVGEMNAQVKPIRTVDGRRRCFVLCQSNSHGGNDYVLVPLPEQPDTSAITNFSSLPVAVIKISTEGELIECNAAAQHMLGATLVAASHISDVMEGLGRPMKGWLADAAKTRFQNHSEFLRLKRDDVETFVQVTLGQVTEQGNDLLYAVLQDATELKNLEARFVQSQKMQAIGQLAGGVAHDFNNLLTAITGHCDLLLLKHGVQDADHSDLIQIKQNADRAAALVGQLLAFSRRQTLQPVTLCVQDGLSELTHLLNRLVSEKVTLRVDHAPNLKCISVDKAQFEQVIVNIVVNARDAMPDGGSVDVTSSNLTLEEPLHRDRAVVPPGDYVCIKIKDEGTGIDQDKCQKVFEPFYTTKGHGEGTGLGLSTAYGIVKQSGGFIFLDSTVGQGTEFTLLFPSVEPEKQQADATVKTPELAKSQNGGVVLLVEDEAPVRAFACRALQFSGYTVVEASCGEEALDLLQDDPELQVDLFVSDVVMPGMDGPTWVKEARKSRPDTHVIFMSGYAEESFAKEKAELTKTAFLPKPFTLTALTTAVEAELEA